MPASPDVSPRPELAANTLVGVAETRGRRPSMEDRHRVVGNFMGTPNRLFVGLFDGHGGAQAAQIAANELHTLFHRLFYDNYQQRGSRTLPDLIAEAFIQTDRGIERVTDAGTTALVAYQEGRLLAVANAGDSRAVLVTDGEPIRMSRDNKAGNPSGIFRAKQAGGAVIDNRLHVPSARGGHIALSRALGDRNYGNALPPNPEVRLRNLAPQDRALVMACDGVWDVMTDLEAANIVKVAGYNPDMASQALMREAYTRGSGDNLTVMVLKFPEQPKRPNKSGGFFSIFRR